MLTMLKNGNGIQSRRASHVTRFDMNDFVTHHAGDLELCSWLSRSAGVEINGPAGNGKGIELGVVDDKEAVIETTADRWPREFFWPMRSMNRSTSGLLTNLKYFFASRRNSRLIRVSSSSLGGPRAAAMALPPKPQLLVNIVD